MKLYYFQVSLPRAEIFVYLLEEGTDVWRPVKAEKLSENKYKIIGADGYDRTDEKWQFLPGDIVECEARKFKDGKIGLVATQRC